jgi:hypothetical protein
MSEAVEVSLTCAEPSPAFIVQTSWPCKALAALVNAILAPSGE